MQNAVALFISFNCKFTKESSSEKKFLNRLRIDRNMVMSLWLSFWPTLYSGVLQKKLHCRNAAKLRKNWQAV